MDFRALWTAPFPNEPTLTISEIPGFDEDALDFDLDDLQDSTLPNGSSSNTPTPFSGESSGAEPIVNGAKARRKPIPRKGHKKSRGGCYSCKRRKIKCSEARPRCEHCLKAGTTCDYPQPADHHLVLASPAAPLQTSPTTFSMDDMRFFHHFIVRGYPHLPVGADHTWTMEIPAIAHQVGLMLSLSATLAYYNSMTI
jgi:hypothetical protein